MSFDTVIIPTNRGKYVARKDSNNNIYVKDPDGNVKVMSSDSFNKFLEKNVPVVSHNNKLERTPPTDTIDMAYNLTGKLTNPLRLYNVNTEGKPVLQLADIYMDVAYNPLFATKFLNDTVKSMAEPNNNV